MNKTLRLIKVSQLNNKLGGLTNQTLSNMIYRNLKQEIVLNKTKSEDPSFSIESSQKLDVTDLLLYRGEKYKENKSKLIEQSEQRKVKE